MRPPARPSTADSGLGMDDDVPLVVSIRQLHEDPPRRGTLVEMRGVVVTSPIQNNRFYVQELGSMSNAGAEVSFWAQSTDLPASPGDKVTIVGRLESNYGSPRIDVGTGNAIAAGVMLTGSGPLPEPVVLRAEDLG